METNSQEEKLLEEELDSQADAESIEPVKSIKLKKAKAHNRKPLHQKLLDRAEVGYEEEFLGPIEGFLQKRIHHKKLESSDDIRLGNASKVIYEKVKSALPTGSLVDDPNFIHPRWDPEDEYSDYASDDEYNEYLLDEEEDDEEDDEAIRAIAEAAAKKLDPNALALDSSEEQKTGSSSAKENTTETAVYDDEGNLVSIWSSYSALTFPSIYQVGERKDFHNISMTHEYLPKYQVARRFTRNPSKFVPPPPPPEDALMGPLKEPIVAAIPGTSQVHHSMSTSMGREKFLNYYGHWVKGEMHGFGIYVFSDGCKYKGEWSHSKQHGKGTADYPDGSTYEGEWKNGKRNGKGKFTCPNGLVYEGEWHKGRRQGDGVATYPSGAKYEGEWKADLKWGKGTLTTTLGVVYSGVWQRGLIDGTGVITIPNKSGTKVKRYAKRWPPSTLREIVATLKKREEEEFQAKRQEQWDRERVMREIQLREYVENVRQRNIELAEEQERMEEEERLRLRDERRARLRKAKEEALGKKAEEEEAAAAAGEGNQSSPEQSAPEPST